MRGYLGTAPHRACASSLLWWLGPTFFFREALSPVQVACMAQRGPRYTGTFAAHRSHSSLAAGPSDMDHLHILSTLDPDAELDADADTGTPAWLLSSPTRQQRRRTSQKHLAAMTHTTATSSSTSSSAPASVALGTHPDDVAFDAEAVVFAFHAQCCFSLPTLAPLLVEHSAYQRAYHAGQAATAASTSTFTSITNTATGGSAAASPDVDEDISEGIRSVFGFCGATAPGILLPNSAAPALFPAALAQARRPVVTPASSTLAASSSSLSNTEASLTTVASSASRSSVMVVGSEWGIGGGSGGGAGGGGNGGGGGSSSSIAWPAAYLAGGAYPLRPLSLTDAMRSVGGMRALLPLLARAATASASAMLQVWVSGSGIYAACVILHASYALLYIVCLIFLSDFCLCDSRRCC